MGGIPRGRKGVGWYFRQASVYDIGNGLFTAVVGLSAAANYQAQNKPLLALLVGGSTIGVCVFQLVKNGVLLAEALKKDSVHELEGCLHTLHAALDPTAISDVGRVRLALHRSVKKTSGYVLEQVTEYIGDKPKSGRIGRQFPADAGIIGRVFRDNIPLVAKRVNDDYEAYVQELINEWNYKGSLARLLSKDTMAWMAVPFYDTDNDCMMAVLYLDSKDREFFTPSRQETVLSAVNGIAIFIGKRYA